MASTLQLVVMSLVVITLALSSQGHKTKSTPSKEKEEMADMFYDIFLKNAKINGSESCSYNS